MTGAVASMCPTTRCWPASCQRAVALGIGTAMVYPALIASVSDHAHPTWRANALGTYRFRRDIGYAGALVTRATLHPRPHMRAKHDDLPTDRLVLVSARGSPHARAGRVRGDVVLDHGLWARAEESSATGGRAHAEREPGSRLTMPADV